MKHCSHQLGSLSLRCNHEAAWDVSRGPMGELKSACRKHLSAVAEEMTGHDSGTEIIISWIWASSPEPVLSDPTGRIEP